jgi:hypothetical protein
MLRLVTDAGSDVTIVDGGVGDSSADDGVVLFSGALSGWGVNVSTGLSKPLLGAASEPILDLGSVNVTSGNAPSLIQIWLTDTGFTSVEEARARAEIGGTTMGNVTFQAFYDASNTAFGQATTLMSETFASTPFAGSTTTSLSSPTPFSLTLLVSIFHDGSRRGQVSSFDATVKVPEPSSLLLVGAGLLAMALVVRRRRAVASV